MRIFTELHRNFPRAKNPNNSTALAAAYTLLERPEEAAELVKWVRENHPGFNLSQWKYLNSWELKENRERLYNAAKLAGIPEFPNDKSSFGQQPKIRRRNVTIQLTSDLPDSGVKSAHIRLYTARFILVLEQIRGNLNSYQ